MAGAGDDLTPPALLLVVDDWDVLAQRTDDVTHGTLVERLLGLIREGAGVGLTAVLAGDRALLVGRAASALTHRVLLRLADRTDLVLAGIPAKAVPTQQPPGRGVLLDGTEVQVAVPPTSRGAAASGPRDGSSSKTDPPGRWARCMRPIAVSSPRSAESGRTTRRPWRVDALPDRVDAASLPRADRPTTTVLLGLGGDELAPLGLSPTRDGRRWIVSGSNGSGVSTTLMAIAADLLGRDRRVAVIATRPGPWAALRHDPRVTWCDDPTQPGELVALRRSVPDLAVLVDNADELLDTAVESALKQVAALVDRDGGLIVGGANAGVTVGAVPRPRGGAGPTPHRRPAGPGEHGRGGPVRSARAGRPVRVTGSRLRRPRRCGDRRAGGDLQSGAARGDYCHPVTLTPDLAALGDEKFVSLTTFRKSGVGVPTTVWVGRDGDSLVVTTPSGSGKVKRVRSDERIELQPSSRRGTVDASVPAGRRRG